MEDVDLTNTPTISLCKLCRYASTLEKFFIFFGFLTAIAAGIFETTNVIVFSSLIGDVIAGTKDAFTTFLFKYTLIGTAAWILCFISNLFFNYITIKQIYKIKLTYLQTVVHEEISWYDLHDSEVFAKQMTNYFAKFEKDFGENVTLLIYSFTTYISCIFIASYKGYQFSYVCLIYLAITSFVINKLLSKLTKTEENAYAPSNAYAQQVLMSIKTVISFGGEQKESEKYGKSLLSVRDNNIKICQLFAIHRGLLKFFIYATYALAFWYCVKRVLEDRSTLNGTYDPKIMFTIIACLMQAVLEYNTYVITSAPFNISRRAASKIFDVIDNSNPVINEYKMKGLKPRDIKGNIEFKDVHFQYPSSPGIKVLQGLNLSIKSGETVSLIDTSGCGKSCIELIQRFYDPDCGDIMLDGNNLKELNLNWFRSNVAVVAQDPILFDATIAENIKYGNVHARIADIERVAKICNVHNFINVLPHKYDTLIGEQGMQLLEDQKLRIAFVRALIRNPRILILDKTTSVLNANVEAILDEATKERTTIIIQDSLSTIQRVGKIVLLSEGVVIEQGTHEELMEMEGEYYKLVTASEMNSKYINEISDNEDLEEEHTKRSYGVANDDLVNQAEAHSLSLWDIIKMSQQEWCQISVISISALIVGTILPIFAILFSKMIGVLMNKNSKQITEETNTYCILFVIIGIIVGCTRFAWIYWAAIASEKIKMRLRKELFQNLLKQEMGWYNLKQNSVVSLCQKLYIGTFYMQSQTLQFIGPICESLSTLILSIVLSIYYEWKLAFVGFAFVPIIMLAVYGQVRTANREEEEAIKKKSTKVAAEVVTKIRTINSLSCENTFLELYINELIADNKAIRRNCHIKAIFRLLYKCLIVYLFSASVYYGGYLMQTGNMDATKVFIISHLLMVIIITIINHIIFVPKIQTSLKIGSQFIQQLNQVSKDARNLSDQQYSLWTTQAVDYNRIYFNNPPKDNVPAFWGIYLSIKQKSIALIGQSGCEIATIIDLLERFYNPLTGTIILETENVKAIPQSDLINHLSIILKDPKFFNRTIAENIAYGDNDRDVMQGEVIKAAKDANIHNFISSLPLGYDTILYETDAEWSSFQKQRIAIARALIRNPKVLLFEALHAENEKVVQDIERMGITCITVEYYSTPVQEADVICIVHERKIVELGTHLQLLNEKELYYDLHNLHHEEEANSLIQF